MTEVWDYSRASGTPLLVLLKLADWADDAGECWPSISKIAEKCRLKDDRHVKRIIHETLERELGEVVVIPGGGKSSSKGGLRSNSYRIVVHLPDEDPTMVVVEPLSGSGDGGSQTTQIVAERPPAIVVEGPPEPSYRSVSEPSKTCEPVAGEFASVWNLYPRKVDRVRGLRAYSVRRREGAAFAELLAATRNYATAMQGTDPKFVKHAATFFGPDRPYADFVDGIPGGAVSKPRSESMAAVDRVLASVGEGDVEISG